MIRLVLEKGRVETLVRRLGQGGWREWVGSASWRVAGGLFTFMCFRDVNLLPQGAGTWPASLLCFPAGTGPAHSRCSVNITGYFVHYINI